MDQIRSIIIGVVGLAVAVVAVLVFATVGVAMIGLAFTLAGVGLVVARLRNRSAMRENRRGDDPHIWNDGRGTIIDM
ncbi:hypothetical protein K1W69_14300 [Hoeflea sp. WL0058]|uniref:Uncharacterized protein n=1 Tax=Flavimaribacter sediminis TaxID=2865987 RepID=A0AAE3D114_9HYPH|nr:hypothetical protein [Flavimaribacter sediminis]MBW8638364.1 hypothetical protein [Flavimaribacter sediminis]